MVAMMARIWIALLLMLALVGCDRCRKQPSKPPAPQPAGPRERAAIDYLITGRSALPPDLAAFDSYESLVAELEKAPAAALLAVRERRAPDGSREDLYLRVLERRFSDVAAHRRRIEALQRAALPGGQLGGSYSLDVSSLSGRDADAVWTEALLGASGPARTAAVLYLDRIGTPLAVDALAYAASMDDTFGSEQAAKALGRRGEADRLVTALAAWESSTRAAEVAGPLAGLAYLRPDARARANDALLAGLAASDATERRRKLLLHGIAITGDKDTIARLAALRQTSWGEAQKGEIDAAIERIATRPPPDKSQPPIDWNEDLITGEKRRQGQLLRKSGGP